MDPKFAAGVICFSTRRKSPVAGPSGEPCPPLITTTHTPLLPATTLSPSLDSTKKLLIGRIIKVSQRPVIN